MPTMTPNELRDLESERESFILHEQRIIQERDEILKNVRNHLDQLDMEIVRLGGAARCDAARFHAAALLSSLSNDNGYVPSIEPFPSVKSSSHNSGGKKSRGRPHKSDEGRDSPTDAKVLQNNKNEGSGESQKKKRKREKENAASNNVPSNGDGASHVKKMRVTETSIAASKKESSDLVQVGDGMIKALNHDKAEPWICLCGNQLAADRSRCGKCRRWKGGKRQKRWSLKSRSASPMAGDAAKAKYKSKKTTAPKRAIDVYKNAAEEKSAADGAMILANMGKFTLNGNPRNEIVYVLGHMVSAVANASCQSKPKAKGPKKKKENAGGDTSNVIKRKRGRPRKDSNKAHQDLSILRVVSTSDSDNGSATEDPAAPCKTSRPKKQKEVAENGQDKKVDDTADASLALKQSQLDAAEEKKTKSVTAATHVTASAEEKLMQAETKSNAFATDQVAGDFIQSVLTSK